MCQDSFKVTHACLQLQVVRELKRLVYGCKMDPDGRWRAVPEWLHGAGAQQQLMSTLEALEVSHLQFSSAFISSKDLEVRHLHILKQHMSSLEALSRV